MTATKPADKLSTDFYVGMAAPLIFTVCLTLFFVPIVLLKAVVLMFLWNWYVVPWAGAPAMALIYACGLVLMFHLLTWRVPTEGEKKRSLWKGLWHVASVCLTVLAFGWLGTLFM